MAGTLFADQEYCRRHEDYKKGGRDRREQLYNN